MTFRKYSSNVYIFVISLFLTSIVSTSLQGTFHNYLHDIFSINANQRGFLEFPRELPGLLVFVFIGLFAFLGERKLIAISTFLTGFGLFGLGYLSPTYYTMICFMILWSIGSHIHMTLREPLAISLSSKKKKGFVLGQINAVRSAGIISGTILIWVLMGHYKFSYAQLYLGAFILSAIASVLYIKIKLDKEKKPSTKFTFILKKKYSIFYLISAIFGVRKQLFLVFAPWLLIKLYNQQPQDLAKLLLVSSVLGIFLKPWLGKLIDKYGERKILFIDALLIILLSSFYAIAPLYFAPTIALYILYLCFILDEILFSLRTARTTYLYKILETPSDLTPTLSMGLSIEHLVSMTGPILAGFLWFKYGFYWVFIMSSVIALFSALVVLKIPKKL